MPRLEGKPSGLPQVVVWVLILLAVFLVLEYLNIIDIVPNFGRP